jgi:hypothetical protein
MMRKYAGMILVAVFFAFALAAIVLGVHAMAWYRDAELIQTTEDVNEVVARIYEQRATTGTFPRTIAELRPIAGDISSKHEKDYFGEDNDFCHVWCWTYLYRSSTEPLILRRYVGDHGYLMYTFAPTGNPSSKKSNEESEEGWIVTSEGRARHLGPFFANHPSKKVR